MRHFLGVLLLALTPVAMGQTDACLTHFQESGSLFKGKVLETYAELAGVDKAMAMRRLQTQLPDSGVSVVSVDADEGVIRGENQSPNARPFPMEFTVTRVPGGVRLRLWLKFNGGQMVVGGTKPAICQLLQLATTEPAARPSPVRASERMPTSSSAPSPAPKTPPASTLTETTEAPMHNKDVLSLVAAGLDADVIVAKIKQAPVADFDVSTDSLIALKKQNVNKAIVTAMIERGNMPHAGPPPRTATVAV